MNFFKSHPKAMWGIVIALVVVLAVLFVSGVFDFSHCNTERKAASFHNTSDGDVPPPVDPKESKISGEEKRCHLAIRCDTILNNTEKLNKEKKDIIPKDGVIYAKKEVVFYEGETVFDVISRETKNAGIHLDFEKNIALDSIYIKGIANIYEMDCGDLSGWLYKVNGLMPNYGYAQYKLKEGDFIEFLYSCDMGNDI